MKGLNTVTVLGTIDAPAGSITVEGDKVAVRDGAQLLSRGSSVISQDKFGRLVGKVLDGGRIQVAGQKLTLDAGSIFDVSGTSTELDVAPNGNGLDRDTTRRKQTIASNGGSIQVTARGPSTIESTFRGNPGGPRAAGGRLSVSVESAPDESGVSRAQFITTLAAIAEQLTLSSWRDVIGLDLDAAYGGLGSPVPLIITQEILDAVQDLTLTLQNGPITYRAPTDPLGAVGLTPEILDAFINFAGLDFTTIIRAKETRLSVDGLRNGGFDYVGFGVPGSLKLEGDVTLATRGTVALSSFNVVKPDNGTATIKANYVSLGGSTDKALAGVPSLMGRLVVEANAIDISGFTSAGIADTILRSGGDLRLTGSLFADGRLTLQASQIYPGTGVNARIETPKQVTILGNGSSRAPLSAGGKLTIAAPIIEQFGTLRAPTGELTLNASERIVLGEGSLTSVSAEGAIVPYGYTKNGDSWYYMDDKRIIAPPEKRMLLQGPTIDMRAGAVVDISGGGDLFASEFVPGPGGSRDILLQPGMFAIMPGQSGVLGPYDAGARYAGAEVGAQIYLAGGNGVAAGYYTLLPANYALLPGAYLVSNVKGSDFTGRGMTMVHPDGTILMPGYRSDGLSGARAQYDSMWRVMSGATVRSYSEYYENTANAFFTSEKFRLTQYRDIGRDSLVAPRLPIDGGILALKAQQDLLIAGTLRSRAAEGGRGGLVDIAAAKIAVVGVGQESASLRNDGYLVIDSASLSNFGAASLLLGGTRSAALDGVRIDVAASDVIIRNDEGSALVGSEIILTAKERMAVEAGSVIAAEGTLQADSGDLLIAPQVERYVDTRGNADPSDDIITPARDWGALLRVSNGGAVMVKREGAESSNGVLEIGAGAVLRGGASLILDATKDTIVTPGTRLSGVDVSIASGRIGVGGGTSGLILGNETLASLASTQKLTLASYSTIDFYGSVNLASGALQHLTLDAAAIVGYGSVPVAIEGKQIRLVSSGRSFTEPTGTGSGTLTIAADELILGAGDKHLRGFSSINLVGRNAITGEGRGSAEAGSSALTLRAPVVTGAGAQQSVTTSGALIVTGAGGAGTGRDSNGSRFDFAGGKVAIETVIDLLGGTVTATASAGDVVIGDGGVIDVGGFRKDFFDVAQFGRAGRIGLTATAGSVRVQGGGLLNFAAHTDGGDAGTLDVVAIGGTFDAVGAIRGHASANAIGGSFSLDTLSVPNFGALNQMLNTSGVSEARSFRVRSGDIVLDGVTQARQLSVQADHGSVTVTGTLDASSHRGGRIEIAAARNLVVASGARLLARNTGEFGSSRVFLETRGEGGGIIDVQGALIDVTSPEGGRVLIRAPQTRGGAVVTGVDVATDVAVGNLDAVIIGARESIGDRPGERLLSGQDLCA